MFNDLICSCHTKTNPRDLDYEKSEDSEYDEASSFLAEKEDPE